MLAVLHHRRQAAAGELCLRRQCFFCLLGSSCTEADEVVVVLRRLQVATQSLLRSGDPGPLHRPTSGPLPATTAGDRLYRSCSFD